MKYDLAMVALKSSDNLCLQSTAPEVLNWLVSKLAVYPHRIEAKSVQKRHSGKPFRYEVNVEDGREAVHFLVQQLCQDGWQPVSCFQVQAWMVGGFFQRSIEEEED